MMETRRYWVRVTKRVSALSSRESITIALAPPASVASTDVAGPTRWMRTSSQEASRHTASVTISDMAVGPA